MELSELEENNFNRARINRDAERLLITAHLKSSVSIGHSMHFDGILSFARLRYHLGDEYYNLLSRHGQVYDIDLPIKKDRGAYLASRVEYEGMEYTNRWRKRFDVQQATEWKDGKIVYLNSGHYKNYNMRIDLVATEKLCWICVGIEETISELLKVVYAVGKKRSQGYGIVDKWEVQKTDRKGVRAFPVEQIQEGEKVEYTSYKPPYNQNFTTCVYERF